MKIILLICLSMTAFFATQNIMKTIYITEDYCKNKQGLYSKNEQNSFFKNEYRMNIKCLNINM